MLNKYAVVTLIIGALLVASAAAQTAPGTLGVYYTVKAKPGHAAQLEAGLKKHRDFHQQVGDKFDWVAWQIETGPETGAYVVGSFGHTWKDFDSQEAFGEKDMADYTANVTPHEESVRGSYWDLQRELSLAPENSGSAKFLQLVHFRLKPTKVARFRELVGKVNEALKKADPQGRRRARWYALVNGGDGPDYALVQDRDSWADFGPSGKSAVEALREAFGVEEGNAIWAAFPECYDGTSSYVMRYRPDLSLVHPR